MLAKNSCITNAFGITMSNYYESNVWIRSTYSLTKLLKSVHLSQLLDPTICNQCVGSKQLCTLLFNQWRRIAGQYLLPPPPVLFQALAPLKASKYTGWITGGEYYKHLFQIFNHFVHLVLVIFALLIQYVCDYIVIGTIFWPCWWFCHIVITCQSIWGQTAKLHKDVLKFHNLEQCHC